MDIVFIASHEYFGPFKFRPQHLADGFSKKGKVLYVDPLRAYRSTKPKTWNQIQFVNNHLCVFSPLVLPGASRLDSLRSLNLKLLKRSILKMIEQVGLKDYVCLISTPFGASLAGQLGELATYYDCNDNWMSIPKLPHHYLREQERSLLEQSRKAFVTSEALYEEKSALIEDLQIVRSGASVEHFQAAIDQDLPKPPSLAQISGKIVGTIGSVNATKDDLNVLDALARPDNPWTLAIVGPIMPDVDLSLYPNLKNHAVFVVAQPFEELPRYVKHFDICVIPYQKNSFTWYANPTKMLEFFSMGKTVVATNLPEVMIHEKQVYVASDEASFLAATHKALEEPKGSAQEKIDIARSHSWQKITETLWEEMCV